MEVTKAGSRPSKRAPAAHFTGTVWQDVLAEQPAPARARLFRVAFEPGARTNWHHHPYGQTLHVLQGAGLFGLRGGPVRRIMPGDSIWIPPGEEHWHGAGPDTGMVHLALQEAKDGATATWLEPVSDEDYAQAPEA